VGCHPTLYLCMGSCVRSGPSLSIYVVFWWRYTGYHALDTESAFDGLAEGPRTCGWRFDCVWAWGGVLTGYKSMCSGWDSLC
jgi:hypothetical protein